LAVQPLTESPFCGCGKKGNPAGQEAGKRQVFMPGGLCCREQQQLPEVGRAFAYVAAPARALNIRPSVLPAVGKRNDVIHFRGERVVCPALGFVGFASANAATPTVTVEHRKWVDSLGCLRAAL
jgi:hypothetical protein